jgi:hypothetical protein
MSLPDSTQAAALSDEVIKPVFFAWLDIDTDPIRANTAGKNITPSGTGDADLDDLEFIGISGAFVDISPVSFRQGGSDSVTAQLSGIPGLDDDTLALIDDKANWIGRDARLWRIARDASNVQQGGFHAYYTGKMTDLHHNGSGENQQLTVTIEGYLSVFSAPSNNTYLSQTRYDSGDLSPQAAIAIANGNYTGALVPGSGKGNTGEPGSGGGGGMWWKGGPGSRAGF